MRRAPNRSGRDSSSWWGRGSAPPLGGLLLAFSIAATGGARADTIVLGSVVDVSTQAPIGGATVSIRAGSDVVGTVLSGADGRFRLPFDVGVRPEAKNLSLSVERAGYSGESRTVVVASGRASEPSYRVELLPENLVPCRRPQNRAIVVGYFRPPASGDAVDFASRVADALSYDLLTRVQRAGLRPAEQPNILACADAKPRTLADYGNFAKALLADAFLAGYVTKSGERFKVEMSVEDGFGVFGSPRRISNRDVNLDDPAAARLDTEAHGAILTALIAGYETAGKAAECVELCAAAERMLGTLPPAIADLRKKCRGALPNSGLLPGGTP